MENKSQLKQFNDELQMVLIKYTATLVDSDGMIVVHMPSKDDRNIILSQNLGKKISPNWKIAAISFLENYINCCEKIVKITE